VPSPDVTKGGAAKASESQPAPPGPAAPAVAVPAARPPSSPVTAFPPAPPGAPPAPRARPGALTWIAVIVPGLAELLIGGYRIGQPSLWRDEGYTREVALRSTAQILALLRHQDAVHGLYYLGVHGIVDAAGASATALRLPSLLAASLAAALTAALGRRLAQAAALPAPRLTGLLAGLLLAALPMTTWYAQDARPYAAATLLAVAASYLLVRGLTEGRGRRWWAGYGTAVIILALLNLVALLLVAAHGVSVLVARRVAPPAARPQLRAASRRWLLAVTAALVALVPLMVYAARQNTQLNWVERPTWALTATLITNIAGARDLLPLALALALAGVAADVARHYRVTCPPAAITVPWLLLPPVTLLLVSLARPLYVERYVVFCTPAAALLMAGGLAWLTRLAALAPPARRWPGLAALPAAALLAVMALVLIGPQQRARTTAARTDDLRRVAAIVTRNEVPGDAVLYLPWGTRVAGLAYPGPFLRLRSIGMQETPAASATLTGVHVSPARLARRFGQVRLAGDRVWLIEWRQPVIGPSPLVREERALLRGLRLVRRWAVSSVMLSLYATSVPGGRVP
jgi:mannosyltransferase